MKDDDQGDLFMGQLFRFAANGVAAQHAVDKALARNSDPDTSHAAADSIPETRVTKMEAQVLEALRNHPHGLTSHGLVEVTGLPWNSVTPRIRPLVEKGLVYDSKNRRLGPAGKYCIVWKAKVP